MTEKKEALKEENKSVRGINYTAIAALSAIIGGVGVFAAGPKSYQVEMIDVNQDGKADIIVTDYNRQVKVYFANDEGGKREYLSVGELTNRYEKSLQTLESKLQ